MAGKEGGREKGICLRPPHESQYCNVHLRSRRRRRRERPPLLHIGDLSRKKELSIVETEVVAAAVATQDHKCKHRRRKRRLLSIKYLTPNSE